jgi:hypothetical protein
MCSCLFFRVVTPSFLHLFEDSIQVLSHTKMPFGKSESLLLSAVSRCSTMSERTNPIPQKISRSSKYALHGYGQTLLFQMMVTSLLDFAGFLM